MISPQPHATSGGGLGRAFRYLYRVPLLLIHILVLLPLVLLSMVPLWSGIRVAGLRIEHLAVRLWSAGLMRIFGFRLRPTARRCPIRRCSWPTMSAGSTSRCCTASA